MGDDVYAVSALLRWVHPWKTLLLVTVICVLIVILLIFPFHRLLLCVVVASFSDGFVHRYKYRAINWYRRQCRKVSRRVIVGTELNGAVAPVEEKPPKPVEVRLFGMTLNCSSKSSLCRLRNFLNSMPNDRDLDGRLSTFSGK